MVRIDKIRGLLRIAVLFFSLPRLSGDGAFKIIIEEIEVKEEPISEELAPAVEQIKVTVTKNTNQPFYGTHLYPIIKGVNKQPLLS